MTAAAGLRTASFGGLRPVPRRTRARRLAAVGRSLGALWLSSTWRAPLSDRDRRFDAIRQWGAEMIRGLDLTVVQRGEMAPRHEAALLVANHVSWLDICALSSVDGTLFVAKSDVAGWPVMGTIARRFGHFFHERGNLRDAARVKDRVAQALAAGWRVTVFPEGTTGYGTELQPFFPAMAQAAVDSGAAVQPVALRYLDWAGAINLDVSFVGEQTFVNSLGKVLGQREIIVEVIFGQPIPSAGRSRRELSAACHRTIADALGVAECRRRPDPRSIKHGFVPPKPAIPPGSPTRRGPWSRAAAAGA